jgi:YidC/Oxa1 family membrane protein insertase
MSIVRSVVDAAHSALDLLTAVLTPITGSFGAALAIIVFTLSVRLMISPLTYLQVRAERRRAALAPEMAALQAKFPDDPVRLATETIALQRAAGVGPFVSLLPGLAQAPFFMLMFRLAVGGALAGTVFGVPLTAHLFAGLPVFGALIALAALLAWWSSRRMRQAQTAPAAATGLAAAGRPGAGRPAPKGGAGRAVPNGGSGPAGAGTGPAGANTGAGLAGAGILGRISPLLPFLTVAAVAYLPLAGGIYLVTSTAWTALEHAIWRRSTPTLTKL